MPKSKIVFVCQECGYESPKRAGKCPSCETWNSMVEQEVVKTKSSTTQKINLDSNPRSIKDIKSAEHERYDTGIAELNRVLGGGLVQGSLVLISGSPGIGKSTLLLKCADNIAKKYGKVLYISGEESEEQIKIRADRLGVECSDLYILSETNLDVIEAHIMNMEISFVIVDSIQTLYKESMSSAPGSVSQVRECANQLMRIAKTRSIPFFIVAHVTKLGELAGPRVLEHMVDTVLLFEGERTQEFRILRTIKNRFGTTSEIGVFEMRQEGLCEIGNPSGVFLQQTDFKQEGSVVIGVMEGTRPILVEIQALVSKTNAAMPRRTAVGVDYSRLNLILAVLEKKLKIPFYNCDVYVNVVGGLEIEGTSGDLGIAVALISSLQGKVSKLEKMLLVGELGLTGEVRSVVHCERLIMEASKMGFKNIIVPYRNKLKNTLEGTNVIRLLWLREIFGKVF